MNSTQCSKAANPWQSYRNRQWAVREICRQLKYESSNRTSCLKRGA